jgi:Mg/Co/Ni transporter MgtE
MASMHGRAASVLLTTHDPASHATGEVLTGLLVGIVVVLVVFVTVVAWWARRGGPDDPGDGGGGGGGRPPPPDPPGPAWWPEFERDFAEYVASTRAGVPPGRT